MLLSVELVSAPPLAGPRPGSEGAFLRLAFLSGRQSDASTPAPSTQPTASIPSRSSQQCSVQWDLRPTTNPKCSQCQ